MSRYVWNETLEPVLDEGIEAEEHTQRLGRKLGRLAEEGGAMPVVEMDGFVAGLAVLPDPVPAVEWLPQVWGPETVFDNIEEAKEMEGALLRYYNGVALTLEEDPDQYRPLLEKGGGIGAGVVWKPWIIGFARAMRLRPGGWARIESSNELDVQESVLVSQKLYDAANGTSDLDPMGLDLLDDAAPMLIGGLVCDLNAARKSGDEDGGERAARTIMRESAAPSVRESACVCGSERAFSRCCGAH